MVMKNGVTMWDKMAQQEATIGPLNQRGRHVGHVARVLISVYSILAGNLKRKAPLGRPGGRREGSIKLDLIEIKCEGGLESSA